MRRRGRIDALVLAELRKLKATGRITAKEFDSRFALFVFNGSQERCKQPIEQELAWYPRHAFKQSVNIEIQAGYRVRNCRW